MTGGYLPLLGAALRHGPWLAGAAALAASPAGLAVIALAAERRLLRVRTEFTALIAGDPLLAAAVAAGTWLLHGRPPPGPAAASFGTASMACWLCFGLLQWRAELRGGFYTPAQAVAPTKIWHQLVVYPLLGYWVWTAALGGLLAARAGPSAPGPLAARAVIVCCVAGWLAANGYDRRHPRLGHPPYDWSRLRPQPRPWSPQSVTLRAYLRA